MKDKISALIVKYREILVYLVVGVMTTVFSWGVCWICEHFFLDPQISWQNSLINTIGWVAGVCFAYPLNRKWVFQSKNPKMLAEFLGFAGSRVSTWILEVLIMNLCVNVIHLSYWVSKIFIAAVVVTILNYVFSKVFVFRKKTDKEA